MFACVLFQLAANAKSMHQTAIRILSDWLKVPHQSLLVCNTKVLQPLGLYVSNFKC